MPSVGGWWCPGLKMARQRLLGKFSDLYGEQALTWVSGHISGHLVVSVKLFSPQELVPRHCLPLSAH